MAKNTGTGRLIGASRRSPFRAPSRTYEQGYRDGLARGRAAVSADIRVWAERNTVLVDAEDPQERFVHTNDLIWRLGHGAAGQPGKEAQ